LYRLSTILEALHTDAIMCDDTRGPIPGVYPPAQSHEVAMSQELRTTLAIIIITLIIGAPLIFAEPGPANTNYLALVMHLVPPPPPTEIVPPTPTIRPTRTPVPTVGPTATPTLPPPTYNNCQADPNPNAAPNYPVKITAIDKAAETVTLKNVSTETVDLTGWNMCSVTGNQHHPIGSTLTPGASQTYVNTGGSIWNNSSPDPGALYNPAGQLVSYFNS
jgi:hypothetical protein